MRSSPAGVTRRNRLRPGLPDREPSIFAALGRGELVRPVDQLFELGDEPRADGRVASGLVGVVADDEPVAASPMLTSLTWMLSRTVL